MDNAFLVRRIERRRGLECDRQDVAQSETTWGSGDPFSERLPGNELENEVVCALRLLQSVNRGDVRMVHRRKNLRLPLESSQSFRVMCELIGQHLDRDIPVELPISGPIDISHPTLANGRDESRNGSSNKY